MVAASLAYMLQKSEQKDNWDSVLITCLGMEREGKGREAKIEMALFATLL